MTDPETIEQAVVANLPKRALWVLGDVPIVYDFPIYRDAVYNLMDELRGGAFGDGDPAWENFVVFGYIDYGPRL